MREIELRSKEQNLKAIPYAITMMGIAIAIGVFPLSVAFYEYTAAGQINNIPGINEDPSHPELTGSFLEKLETVVKYLIHPDQKDKALWLKIFLVAVPLGFLLMIRGFSGGPLRYLIPLAAGLAFATGLNHAILLVLWQFPGLFSWFWLLAGCVLGIIAIILGTLSTIKNSVLLKTAFHLAVGTFFALFITLIYPFILLGMAVFLKKKRDIPYAEFLSESGNFYNFLILNIFPICFQIVPGLQMVMQKGRQEAKRNKKKYRKMEAPRYASILDVNKLKVGDVILTGKPSWGSSAAIQASNMLSCGADHRYWSHALIYAGCRPDEMDNPDAPRRSIIEAQSNGKGVQEIDLLTGEKVVYVKVEGQEDPVIKRHSEKDRMEFNYHKDGTRKVIPDKEQKEFTELQKELCYEKSYFDEGYYMMVLRHKYITDPKKIEDVIKFCRKKDGDGFGYDTWGVSFYSLCALVPPMLSGWLEENMAQKIFNVGDAYFCSELVADAFLSVREELFDRSPWRVKPLDFRTNPLFKEEDCGYQRIPLNDSAKAEVAENTAHFQKQETKARELAAAAQGDRKMEWEKLAEYFKKAAHCAEKGYYPAYPVTDLAEALA